MNLTVNGVEYQLDISGEGTPLLLLHGFTGSKGTWEFLRPMLSGCRLIAPDLIGHGQTDSPETKDRYSMEKAAKDIKAIVDMLGYDSVHVLGYSMGGRLALSFAAYYPGYVKSLVLESSSPGLKTESERKNRREKDEQLASRIEAGGIERFVDEWEQIPLFASQQRLAAGTKRRIREERLGQTARGLANSLRGMGTGAQPSWWDRLSSFDFPVLLVTGSEDQKFCRIAAEMEKQLNNSRWETVPGAGHAIHVENGEKFGKIIRAFLMQL